MARLAGDAIRDVVRVVPDALLVDSTSGGGEFATPADSRERYVRYLTTRLATPRVFVDEAIAARDQVRAEVPQHLAARR